MKIYVKILISLLFGALVLHLLTRKKMKEPIVRISTPDGGKVEGTDIEAVPGYDPADWQDDYVSYFAKVGKALTYSK